MNKNPLLCLLQLSNSSLPLGAYSYSESLEKLVDDGLINEDNGFKKWLFNELKYGSIRIESAIMIRAYNAFLNQQTDKLIYWNNWLSAHRETVELRQQSWQMGKSLIRLVQALESSNQAIIDSILKIRDPCNYAIAFGLVAANWQISLEDAMLGYLHSWVNNSINAGVKLIPLGQTTGQKILLAMNQHLVNITQEILALDDENLVSCTWGLSLASMQHETQYSRLFRS
jgi:urease accessory protein